MVESASQKQLSEEHTQPQSRRLCFGRKNGGNSNPADASSTSQSRVSGDSADVTNTINVDEVEKFNGVEWWNALDGHMKPLLSFNKIRVPFVRDGLLKDRGEFTTERISKPKPLEGFNILDIGCGGGILSEGLGKVGATVVGIDPGQDNIRIARNHLTEDLKTRVTYECTVIEDYAVSHPEPIFDAVVMSEVVEHVENPMEFIKTALTLLKPGGSVFITTPNRTMMSWFGVIFMAEYVLRILPIGTHEWKKFLTPKEVEDVLKMSGFKTVEMKGISFNPITYVWDWTFIKGMQYALHAVKDK